MTIFMAVAMLVTHVAKKIRLTEGEFEAAFDAVLDLLEQANNEKYRLQPDITTEKVDNP